MTRIRKLMSEDVITVKSSTRLPAAAKLMRDHDIGMLPVVDRGKLKGVITDRDLVIRALANGKTSATVGSILTEGMVCVGPDDDEKKAAKLMSKNDVRRLPVVEGGKLVGVLSVGDIAVRHSQKQAGVVMAETGPET